VQLDAKEIRHANIDLSIAQMKNQKTPLALRLCGQLLLGLARIYELKVRQTSEEAEHVLRKIQQMIGDKGAKAGRRRHPKAAGAGADEDEEDESVHLAANPQQLRAAAGAITARLPRRGADAGGDFADLGAGLIDVDIDDLLDNPLIGGEIDEAMKQYAGEPHITINMDQGTMDLLGNSLPISQSQPAPMTPHTPLGTEPDVDLGGELGGELPFDDENPFEVERESHMSLEEEARRKLDVTDHTDLGGQGGFDDDMMMGLDANSVIEPASAAKQRKGAREEELEDFDAQIDATKQRLEQLSREKKVAKALAKRSRHATYVPVIDDVTELAGATLKGWLADASDIVLRERPVAHLQQHSYAAQQVELMRSSMHAGLQLPGLRYRAEARAALPAGAVPATPAQKSAMADDAFGDMVEEPLHFGEEADFGGQGGGDGFFAGDEGFGAGTEAGQQPLPEDGDEHKSLAGSVAQPAVPEEGDSTFMVLDGPGVFGGGADAESCQADVRAFFGESKRAGSSGREDKENAESGWNVRTKKFHTVLAAQFNKQRKQGAPLSLEGLLQPIATDPSSLSQRPRETAAAAFYQTLVLASSGFVRPSQEDLLSFSDVRIEKTKAFDSKRLPKVATESASASASASGTGISNTQSSAEY
jgi:hypothetical protein